MEHPNPRWPLERAVLAADIPPSSKLVMLTLLTKTSPVSLDLGKWSPGTRKLAELTGLSRNILIKHLGLLESHGWLFVRKRRGMQPEYALCAGQPFSTSAYQRTPPVVRKVEPGVVRKVEPPGGITFGTRGGTKSRTKSDQSDQKTSDQLKQARGRPESGAGKVNGKSPHPAEPASISEHSRGARSALVLAELAEGLKL